MADGINAKLLIFTRPVILGMSRNALRDIPKNGCEGDYRPVHVPGIHINTVCNLHFDDSSKLKVILK